MGIPRRTEFWALREVSFDVRPGEMMGIVGRNGAGKSTLLRLLGGLGKPSEGRVQVAGRLGALLELGGGFIGDLTGRENAILAGVVSGLLRKEAEARMDRIVAFAGLGQFIDEPVRNFSSGMQMRLAFSVAVHSDPQVLLIDEFLSVGDLAFQAKCLQQVEQMKKDGCAIVMVSQGMEPLRDLCDRALWLKQGKVVALGDARDVAGEYEGAMRKETLKRTVSMGIETLENGEELESNRNRFGSGEAKIVSVVLEPGSIIGSGDSLGVRIDFDMRGLTDRPVFVFSISKGDGSMCLDLNTETARVPVPELKGKGSIRLELNRLDLARGEYRVSVGIFRSDWKHAYDFHWEAYPLLVEGPVGGKGMLAPGSKWSIEASESPEGLGFRELPGPREHENLARK
ncbi:MAG: ATP-binding cassette domain-containing protein [Verrucomicrobiota bacterium]